eukprot:1095188-Pelagomonas_calceolata.AAC.3
MSQAFVTVSERKFDMIMACITHFTLTKQMQHCAAGCRLWIPGAPTRAASRRIAQCLLGCHCSGQACNALRQHSGEG